ncbi:NAD(P)/FAD-dependent oxidoreductase [Cellulomonas taurus]|uniref:NAD(P)/FAD-dependent oxidoreductase n=1 Tax=Cellulomonas taurus TaxID=2729175 RepID=UPI00145EED07|nr:FAD-dependent oxidoreductase [Cellulomonas taurus]
MSLPALAWRSETAPQPAVLWHHATSPRGPAPPLDGDTRADVVVIGAGASGLWAAWALLDADPALDLVLIDAGTIGDGASGRGIGGCSAWTDGVLSPHRAGPHGWDTALLRDAVIEVGGTLAADQIDCDFQYRGAVRVAGDRRGLDRLRSSADPEDQELDPGAVRRRLRLGPVGPSRCLPRWSAGTPGGPGGLVPGESRGFTTPDCATVQPAALLDGLATALVSRGARIAERTRAVRISPGAVRTELGIIRADRIVQATGAASVPGGRWSPRPVAESAVATAVVDAARWEQIGLRRGQLLHLAGRRDLRAVRTASDRLVLTGPDTRVLRPGALSPSLADTVGALFPDLAAVPVTHTWSWTRAAASAYPVGITAEGIGWIGGHGPEPIAAANLSGRVLADLITGSDTALTRASSSGWD